MGKRARRRHWLALQPGNVGKRIAVGNKKLGAAKRVGSTHMEMNFMTIPKYVGTDAESSKASPRVDASGRVSSQRRPAREMGHLTCDEREVEDLLSEGEST